MSRRLSVALSALVALLGLGFVVGLLIREREHLADADPIWLLAAVGAAAAAMAVVSAGWRTALGAVGARVSLRHAVTWFFAGEIGKYAPGGVWPVLGRGELASRGGVPRRSAYGSIGLSLAGLYLACSTWVLVLAPVADLGTGWVLLAAAVVVAGAIMIPAGGRLPWLRDRWPSLGFRAALVVVAAYLLAWPFIGVATWCAARAVGEHASLASITAAAAVSWLVGFLTIPSPGGVGAREAAFVAATSLAAGPAAAVAITARLCFVLVDVAGWLLTTAALRRYSMTTTMSPVPTD